MLYGHSTHKQNRINEETTFYPLQFLFENTMQITSCFFPQGNKNLVKKQFQKINDQNYQKSYEDD